MANKRNGKMNQREENRSQVEGVGALGIVSHCLPRSMC